MAVALGCPVSVAKPNDGRKPGEWDIGVYDSCMASSGMGIRYCCSQSGGVYIPTDYRDPPAPPKCVAPAANAPGQQPQGPGQVPPMEPAPRPLPPIVMNPAAPPAQAPAVG
ncbi:hypothetical protein AB0K11_18685 [Mycobacterium sp. NPDC050551]|uniref:hypothetical protein n=1 Tax=Mycobacterium sp. NPDC050551 TaxID=3155407 RepID=UPI00343E6DDD